MNRSEILFFLSKISLIWTEFKFVMYIPFEQQCMNQLSKHNYKIDFTIYLIYLHFGWIPSFTNTAPIKFKFLFAKSLASFILFILCVDTANNVVCDD